MSESTLKENKIAVIGLGNIGLPLAIEFGKKYKTMGFDVDEDRILSLKNGIDARNPSTNKLSISENIIFTNVLENLQNCNIYIISVETAVDFSGKPNLDSLLIATKNIALLLKKNDLVIFESTVFPGCTENICVPILEQFSALKFNIDFFVGYSPERINTADPIHTLVNTVKITAGSDAATAQKVDQLYQSIVESTHSVSSIKVAEAAKLLENAQRDINIAFMNNVANILSKSDIPFDEVWNASSSKWNFLKFHTGLVGGDCLPLASHYLNYLSEENENVLSISRKINDAFPQTIANLVMKQLKQTFPNEKKPNILILGITYKPNTPSVKGSLVPILVNILLENQLNVKVYDPMSVFVDNYFVTNIDDENHYHLIIKATHHQIFEKIEFPKIGKEGYLIFDINQFAFKKN
ncbi:UDP-N-acetyl-D-mannosamine dehydrogenase [Emticicia aquatica]|uniref:UDP-N-acetyl-D-mannosamine dehydrogenase n=1 Tax=Emticicia aquatica TaxID=1681835 RepID=A0ABN8ESA1_9BACT|nr:nucleotide sugar dehydrogenase [Emticicia aquatica]CAH0994806.1 UDP-N-acetyl-D-mannosamine dehydrogenase [Emticicia aquatica]